MTSFDANNWNENEIKEYIAAVGVLVLFTYTTSFFGEDVSLAIHTNMCQWDRLSLKNELLNYFGSIRPSEKLGNKINRYAVRWCNNISSKKARVINA